MPSRRRDRPHRYQRLPGTTSFVAKPMIDRIPPLTIATEHFAFGLLPILCHLGRRSSLDRTSALLGFTGYILFCVTQNVGLKHATASDADLIYGGVPAHIRHFRDQRTTARTHSPCRIGGLGNGPATSPSLHCSGERERSPGILFSNMPSQPLPSPHSSPHTPNTRHARPPDPAECTEWWPSFRL